MSTVDQKVKEGLSEEVAFALKPETSKGAGHGNIWGSAQRK